MTATQPLTARLTPLNQLAARILILVVLFWLFWLAHYAGRIAFNSYPVEYREGGQLIQTQYLLEGRNPYSIENHPQAMNVYGLGYQLVALPLAAVFGNTILVHRVISLVFLFLSCGVLVYWLAWSGTDVWPAAAAGLIWLASLLLYITPTIRPDGMGVFLFLLTIFLPLRYNYHPASLVASLGLGVLAFYTKPYFLLGLGIVAVFTFLFVSKARGFLYGVGAAVLLLVTAALVRLTAECYFYDTFIIHASVAGRMLDLLTGQLQFFALVYSPLFLLLLVNLRREMFSLHFRLDLRALDQPLLHFPLQIAWFAFAVATAAVVLSLGQHPGNYMVYLFQLMTPFLLVGVFSVLDQRRSVFNVPLILINLYILTFITLFPNDQPYDQASWQRVRALLSGSRAVLNSPAIAPLMAEMGLPIVDSGQTKFYYQADPYAGSLLAPPYTQMRQQGQEFLDDLARQVQERAFDYVIITEGDAPLVDSQVLASSYQLIETMVVEMPQTHQYWPLQVWGPK